MILFKYQILSQTLSSLVFIKARKNEKRANRSILETALSITKNQFRKHFSKQYFALPKHGKTFLANRKWFLAIATYETRTLALEVLCFLHILIELSEMILVGHLMVFWALKGLFTIFLFSVRTHILNSNRV